jgi:hypothetical protein
MNNITDKIDAELPGTTRRVNTTSLFDEIEEQARLQSTEGNNLFTQSDWWAQAGGGKSNLWRSRSRKRRLDYLALLAPFTGAAAVMLGAHLLKLIEARTPGSVPGLPLAISWARTFAFIWLALKIFSVLWYYLRKRSFRDGPEITRGGLVWPSVRLPSNEPPPPNAALPHGLMSERFVLRHLGRPGYYFFKLTSPLWVFLGLTLLVIAGATVVEMLKTLSGQLSTAPVTPATPLPDSGAVDQGIKTGQTIRMVLRYIRNVLFVFGTLCFMIGMSNMMRGRPWGQNIMSGAACFGFGGIASMTTSTDYLNTGINGAPDQDF